MLSLPYERSEVEYTSARQTTGAWQYVRLFRHFLNSNYYQVWAGVLQSAENRIKRNSVRTSIAAVT